MTPSQAEMMYSYCKSDSAVSRSRSLCKIKSNIVTTKPLDDWKSYFTKEFAGHQRRLHQSAFGQVLGLVVLLGISVLLWVMAYGLWVYYRY
jgi:hypothetical protein